MNSGRRFRYLPGGGVVCLEVAQCNATDLLLILDLLPRPTLTFKLFQVVGGRSERCNGWRPRQFRNRDLPHGVPQGPAGLIRQATWSYGNWLPRRIATPHPAKLWPFHARPLSTGAGLA